MTPQFAAPSSASAGTVRPRTLRAVASKSFLDCVADVAAEWREHAQADLIDIAYWSHASQGKVSRFEHHLAQPRDLDRLLVAYAKVSGKPASELLREAIRRWEEGGGAEIPDGPLRPLLPPEGEIERRARAATPRRRAPRQRRNGQEGQQRGGG
jgi:hypothetical protein